MGHAVACLRAAGLGWFLALLVSWSVVLEPRVFGFFLYIEGMIVVFQIGRRHFVCAPRPEMGRPVTPTEVASSIVWW